MAAANIAEDAFRAAISRCGFNDISVGFIMDQGFRTAEEFVTLPAAQMPQFIKQLTRMGKPDDVSVPWLSCIKLRALRSFLEAQLAKGLPIAVDDFDNDNAGTVDQWTKRVTDLDAEDDSMDNVPKPSDFSTWKEWEQWEEEFLAYLG